MRWFVSLAVLLHLAGSAEAQASPERDPPRLSPRPDLITLDEIVKLDDARDAYEVIRRLRPQFLNVRNNEGAGRSRPGTLLVYVNNAERGDLSTLRTIPANGILEIRRLSARDAMTRYGKEQNGVILVTVGVMREP